MLRSQVGDEALKRAMQLYREDKMDDDPKEFQRVVERVSKRDLGWFFEDWVYRTGVCRIWHRERDSAGDRAGCGTRARGGWCG